MGVEGFDLWVDGRRGLGFRSPALDLGDIDMTTAFIQRRS